MAINKESPAKSKAELAKQLGVSRQSLYYQPKMPAKDLKLKAEIERVMDKHKAYGHKRIAWQLNANKKRVLRIMKKFNLKPKRQRKAPAKPQDQHQAPMAVPNLIQGIIVETPNKVWVSDFTYLPYFGKFVYLATIEDIFTREIVGWAISTRHTAHLIAEALFNALRDNPAPAIRHSDQGNEYQSDYYLNLLNSFSIKPSMSEKASPWQNGHKESFYSEFKLELGHPECYPMLGELIEAVACQIHYYNNQRIHTALKCPPTVFAQRTQVRQNFALLSQKPPSTILQDEPHKPEMISDTFHSAEKQKSNILTFQEIAKVQSV